MALLITWSPSIPPVLTSPWEWAGGNCPPSQVPTPTKSGSSHQQAFDTTPLEGMQPLPNTAAACLPLSPRHLSPRITTSCVHQPPVRLFSDHTRFAGEIQRPSGRASGLALSGKLALPLIGPDQSLCLCLSEPITATGGASEEFQIPKLQQTQTRLSERSCSGSWSLGLREV